MPPVEQHSVGPVRFIPISAGNPFIFSMIESATQGIHKTASLLDDRSITTYLPLMTEQTKSDQTRKKILTAGRELALKGGFSGVGIAQILAESGVPKGSFYYYFPSKDAFGQAMLHDYVDDYLSRIDLLIGGPQTAGEKLAAFWGAWLGQEGAGGISTRCLVVKLGAEIADLSEGMRVVLDRGVEALVDRIAALLIAGIKDESVRPLEEPQAVARMLYAKFLGAAILAKISRTELPLQQALAETQHIYTPR